MRWRYRLGVFCGVCSSVMTTVQGHGQIAQLASLVRVADVQAPVTGFVRGSAAELPDSPGTVLRRHMSAAGGSEDASANPQAVLASDQDSDQAAESARAKASDKAGAAPCAAPMTLPGDKSANQPAGPRDPTTNPAANPAPVTKPLAPCQSAQNPYQRFLNSTTPIPLTPRQKGYLAVHNFIEPGNLVTIVGTSAIAIASDSHTAYGPGWRGFGRDAGISAVQDATGDFFGTFLIPSIAHEDPHYHRMPNASIARRTLHAISRTVIAQGDDGHPMPNYATLLTYPITAEIANLYVPGVASNGRATVERVLTGYATDPIDNLITEFLPDVAKRIHVRVIFVQQIINQVATGQQVSIF